MRTSGHTKASLFSVWCLTNAIKASAHRVVYIRFALRLRTGDEGFVAVTMGLQMNVAVCFRFLSGLVRFAASVPGVNAVMLDRFAEVVVLRGMVD